MSKILHDFKGQEPKINSKVKEVYSSSEHDDYLSNEETVPKRRRSPKNNTKPVKGKKFQNRRYDGSQSSQDAAGSSSENTPMKRNASTDSYEFFQKAKKRHEKRQPKYRVKDNLTPQEPIPSQTEKKKENHRKDHLTKFVEKRRDQ